MVFFRVFLLPYLMTEVQVQAPFNRFSGQAFSGDDFCEINLAAVLLEILAGAEGFEPSPSSLTVRCPTGWTTPQRCCLRLLAAEPKQAGAAANRSKTLR
jgi:hypothetical protein